MKCKCEECGGTGEIICPACDGTGNFEEGIETAYIDKSLWNHKELEELQQDARRVTEQARRLSELVPHRAHTYEAQKKAMLRTINLQADAEAKRENPEKKQS